MHGLFLFWYFVFVSQKKGSNLIDGTFFFKRKSRSVRFIELLTVMETDQWIRSLRYDYDPESVLSRHWTRLPYKGLQNRIVRY